ncbi:VCBS repeat-containing protein [Carboxylicivirga sediminis]|uniref:VCBS repeat-containing protein n=1 Tax=Carboxylicivirga sediminis TaxID=2006564 RepID=A0A941EXY6_9BACT|nr:FG-GAP-like repeat-containing protein [Carboxylicivirga sediminis]MBR8534021.1 VCBS repeat-containing protein [Carboxylicivirga sediminis]
MITYKVEGSLTKIVQINLAIQSDYANLSLYENNRLLLDNIDIPESGTRVISALVQFTSLGEITLMLKAENGDITVNEIIFEDVSNINLPRFADISERAGMDRVESIKYGGPCIADINQDGHYDFIVTNHNAETNKLYWNNGDGTVTKHNQDLSRWYMQDLHGASCADFDNDGDLDVIQTKGGGNGKNPSLPDLYRNDNGKLTLVTLDAGITVGARGRGAIWSDMDNDGWLDLMLVNAKGIQGETPQHNFYRNKGDGTFELVQVEGIENADAQRALVSDINNDGIDDIVLYDPTNTIWLGNGDFTFTDATKMLPEGFKELGNMMGVTDVDVDNDGYSDLYFARGNAFGVGNKPSFDFCPVHMSMDIKIRDKGCFELAIEADKDIDLHNYDFVGRNGFNGEEFPIFLGSSKSTTYLTRNGRLLINQQDAAGWPEDITDDGIYFGHVGKEQWRSAVVINGDIFWNVGFSLSGIKNASPEFVRLNRNPHDVLLQNVNGKFVDVSKDWNVPQFGNHSGVSVGDFNNDGHQDLFLHRWGQLKRKYTDYMLVNTGSGRFEPFTGHGAHGEEEEGHGDMGQAFDFDNDGRLDLLNGNDEYGMWYLLNNVSKTKANYATVRVGYAPNSFIDATSAVVILETPTKIYRKRVGSSGMIFSQSMLNMIHFGLGKEDEVKNIRVIWRNGEQVEFNNKKANQIFDTDNVDPTSITINSSISKIRKGVSYKLLTDIKPQNANQNLLWTSSDSSVLKVDQAGWVTAVGRIGQSAIITAKSVVNGLAVSQKLKISRWKPIPVNKIEMIMTDTLVYVGNQLQLAYKYSPNHADVPQIIWECDNESVATINSNGVLNPIKSGEVTVKAYEQNNMDVIDIRKINVLPYIQPSIEIEQEEELRNTAYKVGDKIELTVNYHAGSGNTVMARDMGGVKVWFRSLNKRWMADGNFEMIVDESSLGKQSGTMKAIIDLKNRVPSSELAEGSIYYIYVGMASSDGMLYTKEIYPIKVVK